MISRRRKREDLTPDITPLIDIIFLLLVFFMVSSVFKKDEAALLLTLPKSQSDVQAQETAQTLILELSQKEFAVNRKQMDDKEFATYCKGIQNKNIPIDFRIDKDVPYQRIVKILEILQKFELTNLSLVTDT